LLTWPEVAVREAERIDTTLRYMREEVPAEMAACPRNEPMAPSFAGLDESLARGIALRGPELCLPAIAAVASHLPRAVRDLARVVEGRRPRHALHLASYVHAVRCCGGELPPRTDDLEARWLERLATRAADLDDQTLRTAAFAALAVGKVEMVGTFTGRKLSTRFEPGSAFGPDFHGLVRYLATALRASAPAASIAPAWHGFLALFPAKHAADATRWTDLLWCARAIFAGFERAPVESVGRLLHQQVTGP
jgi:hypothetical protein